jgi:hypothetical protein
MRTRVFTCIAFAIVLFTAAAFVLTFLAEVYL